MRVLTKEELRYGYEDILKGISKGDVFIHPTDTIYGLGCDATNEKSIKKLRRLKQMPEKPLSVIAPNVEWILDNCEITKEAEEWLKKLPGPYTLILKLKNKNAVAKNTSFSDTLGVRIPDHWIKQIANMLNTPLITTSANVTGKMFMATLEELDPEIKKGVDFAVYEGEKQGHASTIVDLTKEETNIKERKHK